MRIRERINAAAAAAGRAIDKFMPWYPEIEKAEAHRAAIERIQAEQAAGRHPAGCDLAMVDDFGQCPHLPPSRESIEQGAEPLDAVKRERRVDLETGRVVEIGPDGFDADGRDWRSPEEIAAQYWGGTGPEYEAAAEESRLSHERDAFRADPTGWLGDKAAQLRDADPFDWEDVLDDVEAIAGADQRGQVQACADTWRADREPEATTPARTIAEITNDYNEGRISWSEYETQRAQREAELGDAGAIWDEVMAGPALEVPGPVADRMDAERERAEQEASDEEPEWDSDDSAAWHAEHEPEAGGEAAGEHSGGVTNSGAGTVSIEGQAIGGSGRGLGRSWQATPGGAEAAHVNTGVQNLGRGQIIMDGCVIGDGAKVDASQHMQREVAPRDELEAG